MDVSINFLTDCALIALFDAQVARDTGIADDESVANGFGQISAVKVGDVAIVGLGGDGIYQIRITDGDLTADERDYAAAVISNLGIRVVSGSIHVSGYWFHDERITVPCPNGSYHVNLYEIAFDTSPRWWRADGPPPEDAPANFVAVLHARNGDFSPPSGNLRLDSVLNWEPGGRSFLFDSATRVVGAQPGMELESTVVKRGDGFCLKACGPDSYTAELPAYVGLKWKDRVRFRVTSVNHAEMLIQGELIEKLS